MDSKGDVYHIYTYDLLFPGLVVSILLVILLLKRLAGRLVYIQHNRGTYNVVGQNLVMWHSVYACMILSQASFRDGGRGHSPPPPLVRISPPLGTCKHCMKCGNKTSDASQTFNQQLSPLLDNFSK